MLVARYARFLPKASKRYLIQIGAHLGHEARILDAAGFREIAWIEADPAVYQQLKQNIAQHCGSNHSAFNALITSTSGQHHQFFRYTNSGASSSLYRSTDWFSQTFDGVEMTNDSIELRSLSLDDFVRINNIVPSCLIIDVQGAELEVLKGGKASLSHVNVVEVEVSQQEIYKGGALFDSVHRLLMSNGFTKATHVPWHGDVLYIKADKLGWNVLACIYFTSSLYATEYYLARAKRFVHQLVTRPRATFYKLTSRMSKRLY